MLGGLPLALEQAAAYMKVSGRDLCSYSTLLRTRLIDLMEEGKSHDYPFTVATTLRLSFERIEAASPVAADLLRLCAVLAPDDIPIELLQAGADELPQELQDAALDEVNLDRALAALRDYSLIDRQGGGLSMHRLVQAVVRDSMGSTERQWLGTAIRMLRTAFPIEIGDPATRSTYARILPHARAVLDALGDDEGPEPPATRWLLDQMTRVSYMIPRHPTERDRLDVQHYALLDHIGANYLAPIGQPARVLDVGCGTGQWAYDVCAQFPDALVVGYDVEPSKPDRPENFSLVVGNLLRGLPFGNGQFDFVHQRLMVTAVPMHWWPAVVADLVRVTRPGGWIQLVEGGSEVEPIGSATKRLFQLASRLAAAFGLDSTGNVALSLDDRLRMAGVRNVRRRNVAIPIGAWGGHTGSQMASNFRGSFARMGERFQVEFGLSASELQDLLITMQEECELHRTRYTFTIAFGQVPG
jgi:SAM-dependent methyltransferase